MIYSRRIYNYPKRIKLSHLTYIMSIANLVAIYVERLRINSGCSLEKEFFELIYMNPSMLLYLTINQVHSYHGCVYISLT